MKKCVKCEYLETVNGYIINREEDMKVDDFTMQTHGRKYVFYTVNDEENMFESFKTLREARKWAKEN